MVKTTPISIEVNKILQMVHDDAVKKNHDKLLGFSSRATERILDLIQKEREEAVRGFAKRIKSSIWANVTWHRNTVRTDISKTLEENIRINVRDVLVGVARVRKSINKYLSQTKGGKDGSK